MKPRRDRTPSPPHYVNLGMIAGENELFQGQPLPPPVGLIVGGVYIPPDADDAEVARLLETARLQSETPSQ